MGGDLEPGTLLDAYRAGYFPMPLGRRQLGWFSPDPRAILPSGGIHVSRTLARHLRRFEFTIDACFERVVAACGDPTRPHGWISPAIVEAYTRLHRSGWAHSIEVWQDGELVGGLYGVSIGAFFAGESMFHSATDASKAAMVHLDRIMRPIEGSLIDVQWQTSHLASMGVVEISRREYLRRLQAACRGAVPPALIDAGPA